VMQQLVPSNMEVCHGWSRKFLLAFLQPSPISLVSSLWWWRWLWIGVFLQVCVVGDFSEDEVESCLLDYLGTVTAKKTDDHVLKLSQAAEKPVLINDFSTPEQRHQKVRESLLFSATHELLCSQWFIFMNRVPAPALSASCFRSHSCKFCAWLGDQRYLLFYVGGCRFSLGIQMREHVHT
jgi:hypothetical protein